MEGHNVGGVEDLLECYQKFCVEENCRVNSAIVRCLEQHGKGKPLETLNLKNNYLGPKGLKPVFRLVKKCQSLLSINLDGNGVNNEAVEMAFEVLRDHLSISSISLRDNPISSAGGKYLLDLIQENPNISEIFLDGTDLFDAVKERIQMAAQSRNSNTIPNPNNPKLGPPTPQLVRGDPLPTRGNPKTVSSTFPPIQGGEKKAEISAIPSSSMKTYTAGEVAPPTITPPQPRPPPPAIASKGTSRLPPSKINALREKFAKRLHLASEVNSSEANKRAYEARKELLALESHATTGKVAEEEEEKEKVVEHMLEPQEEAYDDVTERNSEGDGTISSWGDGDNSVSLEEFAQTRKANDLGLKEAVELFASGPEGNSSGGVGLVTEQTAIPVNTGSGNFMGALSSSEYRISDDVFASLFEEGCKCYFEGNLDSAYLRWNDALLIAVEKKNREYIAIVTQNLQRLSYELLVKEGRALLEKGQLEGAGQAFELALDLAKKAHNAAWTTEMQSARKEIQTAVFHRCHEAAVALFEKAKHLPHQTVSEDDFFIIPGKDTMVSHSEAFVNQWSRMLLIQEAIHMWDDASTFAEQIGGAAGLSLQNEVIRESLNSVALFFVKLYFESDCPDHFSFQHSSEYHYHEAVMLSELWADVLRLIGERLQHPLLSAIASAQLGNLYLTTNQFQFAEQQFEAVSRYGREKKDTLLEATGLTYLAVLNWQRSSYTVAEGQLENTLAKWESLRKEMETLRSATAGGENEKEGEGGSAPRKETVKERLRRTVPPEYVSIMTTLCHYYRISLYVNTYRYRDGLEALEEALINQQRDLLTEKIKLNYAARPTLDQIAAISKEMNNPLLFYFPSYHYDWSEEENKFVRSESIFMWFVPLSNEVRFVEMNVTKEFGTTVGELVQSFRQGLCLDPLGSGTQSTEIITKLHRNAWIDPLRILYLIFVEPIFDSIQVLYYNSDDLSNRVITIIPTLELWALPFNAFLNPKKEHGYFIEEVSLQLAFSATQCSYNALSAQRATQLGLRRDLVVMQPELNRTILQPTLRYPVDHRRSMEEGEAVAEVLREQKETAMAMAGSQSVLTNTILEVKDVDTLREALPSSHYVHIAASTTSNGDRRDPGEEGCGAICLFGSFGDGLLWASEIQHMELLAELVTLSNTNILLSNLKRKKDDVLGLLRAFFAGGVPCVIAGQWCTPDMVPADLFVRLYRLLEGTVEVRRGESTSEGSKRSSKKESTINIRPPKQHKAVVLSSAIRSLLAENEMMRYSPRSWAGYYCIGGGVF